MADQTVPSRGNGFKNIAGQRFGMLKALEEAGRRRRDVMWRCICDCGVECVVKGYNLRSGGSTNCGCVRREKLIANATKHGMHATQEYRSWGAMIQRCTNPSTAGFSKYGGRGIAVCDRWRGSFEAFYVDMGPRPSPKHSLERVDNSKGYEPGNVRWATAKEQSRNLRTNRIVTFNGRQMTLAEAAELAGVNYKTVGSRLNRGWTIGRALMKA